MFATPGGARRRCGAILVGLALASAGCGSSSKLDAIGLSGLAPSPSWKVADPSTFLVPGRSVAAWTGPGGSSLVVVDALPAPRTDAGVLAREMTSRLENLPELRIAKSAVRPIGGIPSAWVEIVAPGTEGGLAPTGLGRPIAPEGKKLVPTRRIAAGIPGRDRTVWLIWHAPESEASKLSAEAESAIANLAIRK